MRTSARIASARLLAAGLFFASLAAATSAQSPLRSSHVPTGAWSPTRVTAGDIDEDGLPDFVVGGSVNAQFFFGIDGTSFTPGAVPFGESADVLLADVDLDGHLDLLQCQAAGSVTVRLGFGTGIFGPATGWSTSPTPGEIHVVDVSSDGIPDLVLPCASNRITVRLGVGDGIFGPQTDFGAGVNIVPSMAVADIDEDGALDLIVMTTTGFAVLAGTGAGSFAPLSYVSSVGNVPEFLDAGDFDEDGHVDVAVMSTAPHVVVLFGAGDGSFPTQVIVPTGGIVPVEFAAADFDGDGHLDVGVVLREDDAVVVARGLGDGSFDTPLAFGTHNQPDGFARADFNRDGDPDIVVVSGTARHATLLFGEGNGSFRPNLTVGDDTAGTALADFDEDGRVDLAVACEADRVAILRNTGAGGLLLSESIVTTEPYDLVADDFTGDGHVDLAVVSLLSSGVLLVGAGDGTFAAPVALGAIGSGAVAVKGADFDGDGDTDLVVLHGIPVIYYMNGLGVIESTLSLADVAVEQDIGVGDMNGDGWVDIVVASGTSSPKIRTFLNAGGAGFEPPLVHVDLCCFGVGRFEIADLDADGHLDLVANGVTVLFGAGDGTYGSPVNIAVEPGPSDIGVGDVDGDGDLDVVASTWFLNLNDGALSILLNLGDGTFGDDIVLPVPPEPGHVLVGDLTGDGVDDAIVSVPKSGQVAVLESVTGPWKPLAVGGVGGAAGIPRLIGDGPLAEGTSLRIELRDAPALATTMFVIGHMALLAPFKGGVLVPTPDKLITLLTDAEGGLNLAATWAAVPSGLQLWFQTWSLDPGAPKGLSGSHALMCTVP